MAKGTLFSLGQEQGNVPSQHPCCPDGAGIPRSQQVHDLSPRFLICMKDREDHNRNSRCQYFQQTGSIRLPNSHLP